MDAETSAKPITKLGRPRKVRGSLREAAVFGREPLPVPRPSLRSELSELLGVLEVGGSLDVPLAQNTVSNALGEYRKSAGGKFVVRELKAGWTRIWRVE